MSVDEEHDRRIQAQTDGDGGRGREYWLKVMCETSILNIGRDTLLMHLTLSRNTVEIVLSLIPTQSVAETWTSQPRQRPGCIWIIGNQGVAETAGLQGSRGVKSKPGITFFFRFFNRWRHRGMGFTLHWCLQCWTHKQCTDTPRT